MLHKHSSKVEEKSKLPFSQLKIGRELLFVSWADFLNGLQFEDSFTFDNQVGPKPFSKLFTLKFNRNADLANDF